MGFEEVVEAIAADVARDYRVELEEARALVEPALRRDAKLARALETAESLRAARRTRAFKDARKKARNDVYYRLRQYKRTDLEPLVERLRAADEADVGPLTEAILEAHSSTRERLKDRARFARRLLQVVGDARSVVDVGGGVCALMFPFERAPRLERYLALDRDRAATAAVGAFAARRPEPRLAGERWSLDQGWSTRPERHDVALLFKIIPVIARQAPAALDILAKTPARRLVLSGSRVALAKKSSIEARERARIDRWIAEHGFVPTGERFELEEEFFVVVERPEG